MPEELIPIVLFLCVAAVMILRPITTKLGGLLDVMTRERARVRNVEPAERSIDERTVALIEQVSRRLDLIDERLDFTERLLAARNGETPGRMPAAHVDRTLGAQGVRERS